LCRHKVRAERAGAHGGRRGEVEFGDDTTGKVHTVTLGYPDEADIPKRKISVLTTHRDGADRPSRRTLDYVRNAHLEAVDRR
jgi:hypothetical protein